MDSLLIKWITILPMFLHGAFGCCWHHAHLHAEAEAEVEVEARAVETASTAQLEPRSSQACSCRGHGRSWHFGRSAEQPRLVGNRQLAIADPHSPHLSGSSRVPSEVPCEEDRCEIDAFTTWTKLTFESLDFDAVVLWSHSAIQEINSSAGQHLSDVGEVRTPTPALERARFQVWRI